MFYHSGFTRWIDQFEAMLCPLHSRKDEDDSVTIEKVTSIRLRIRASS